MPEASMKPASIFSPCFLFFLQHGGKGRAELLTERKDGSAEQVMPRIPRYGSAALWEGHGTAWSQSEHGIT